MAVEAIRGCGFRKVGGLYLCGEGLAMACDRLPYELKVCPTCGSGVKFTRGFTWLNWMKYAGGHNDPGILDGCSCPGVCPVCYPLPELQPYGLLWVGEAFYTPESFIEEALELGISRRIPAIPKKLKLGESWVLFAHIKACGERTNDEGKTENVPGVFYAHRPQRLELLIWESEAKEEYLAELEKKGITPIVIPNGDVDHDPETPLKPDEATRFMAETSNKIDSVRKMLGGKSTWD